MARPRSSYVHCNICGHVPRDAEHPNLAPVRWWDADDGWKIGTLCPYCYEDTRKDRPKSEDFAYKKTNGVCDDDSGTDEDPTLALE